jgi:hypothetical protein
LAPTPEERSRREVDPTRALELLLRMEYGGDARRLLGELQLAFVTFLLLSSLAAFEQWKALVLLLSSCAAAFRTRPGLLHNFVAALEFQLKHAQVGASLRAPVTLSRALPGVMLRRDGRRFCRRTFFVMTFVRAPSFTRNTTDQFALNVDSLTRQTACGVRVRARVQ